MFKLRLVASNEPLIGCGPLPDWLEKKGCIYEPKKDKEKDARSKWLLVYGNTQHKNDLPTINMRLLGRHCFYIKKMDVLCKRWKRKGCRQIFM